VRICFKAEEIHGKSVASDCWLECPIGAFRSYGLPLISGQLSSIAILDVQVGLTKVCETRACCRTQLDEHL